MALLVEDAQDLVIFEEAMIVEVGDDHLAGAKAAAVHDARRVHVHQAGLGSGDHQALIVQGEAAGAQAVAIQNRAHLVAVGEGHRGGTVPRLDAIAAVLQK